MRKPTLSFPFEVPQSKLPTSPAGKPGEAIGRYVFGRGQVAMERVTIPPPPRLPSGTQMAAVPDTDRPPAPSASSFDEWVARLCARRAEARNEVNIKAAGVADELEGQLGRRSGASTDRCRSEALDDMIEALRYELEEDVKLLEFLRLLQLDVADSEKREEV